MRVRLVGEMSGTRDGQQWPPRGSTIDLPEDEAANLCQQGMAQPVVALDADVERAVVEAPVEERTEPLTTKTGPGRRVRA